MKVANPRYKPIKKDQSKKQRNFASGGIKRSPEEIGAAADALKARHKMAERRPGLDFNQSYSLVGPGSRRDFPALNRPPLDAPVSVIPPKKGNIFKRFFSAINPFKRKKTTYRPMGLQFFPRRPSQIVKETKPLQEEKYSVEWDRSTADELRQELIGIAGEEYKPGRKVIVLKPVNQPNKKETSTESIDKLMELKPLENMEKPGPAMKKRTIIMKRPKQKVEEDDWVYTAPRTSVSEKERQRMNRILDFLESKASTNLSQVSIGEKQKINNKIAEELSSLSQKRLLPEEEGYRKHLIALEKEFRIPKPVVRAPDIEEPIPPKEFRGKIIRKTEPQVEWDIEEKTRPLSGNKKLEFQKNSEKAMEALSRFQQAGATQADAEIRAKKLFDALQQGKITREETDARLQEFERKTKSLSKRAEKKEISKS